jgi:hypothetical protein
MPPFAIAAIRLELSSMIDAFIFKAEVGSSWERKTRDNAKKDLYEIQIFDFVKCTLPQASF